MVLVSLFECMIFQLLQECFLSSLVGVVDRGKNLVLGLTFSTTLRETNHTANLYQVYCALICSRADVFPAMHYDKTAMNHMHIFTD